MNSWLKMSERAVMVKWTSQNTVLGRKWRSQNGWRRELEGEREKGKETKELNPETLHDVKDFTGRLREWF